MKSNMMVETEATLQNILSVSDSGELNAGTVAFFCPYLIQIFLSMWTTQTTLVDFDHVHMWSYKSD